MSDPHEPQPLPPSLRFLKLLVTTLTAVMIVGIVVIVGLIWSRYSAPRIGLPESIALPEGAQPLSFTAADTWYAVVTQDNRILIFDRATGALRQEVTIDR